ncbi:DUF5340 domain-containing protein [Argonema antarcticum]|uniref:DUF5340 domain-containing protein n=1 Tax=Argonema antarcticum TaxID=2942763 RepID=UPI002011AD1D|nr:DUF5340 domain-containing protein [Argonema antarcticum]MCL1475440.1 DUF5340 domain-containing protein [Argonema antarcticum A004/B2]
MEPILVPSPVHYELILQLLERQTMFAASQKPELKEKVHQLIITLRKAVAIQKQIEETCERANLPMEHRWSINHVSSQSAEAPKLGKPDLNSRPDRLNYSPGSPPL